MIIGRRVRLRPVEEEDLPRFVSWLADPEVRRHLALYHPMGMEQERRWFEANVTAGDTQAWSIDCRAVPSTPEVWQHIGSCGFHAIDWRNRVGELGILIGAKDYWGQGYGTDATRTLVRWGFGTLNLNRIFLKVFADNARAIRCYEKVGFQLEGRLRQDNFDNGAYRDTLVMGILREEYSA
jgi:RimJ/RimL family protein N-acetyltransferase